MAGVSGSHFLADNSDLLEDVCLKINVEYLQPVIKDMESKRTLDNRKERILSDAEKGHLKSMKSLLLKALPVVLQVLNAVA
jgi:hypothetical protein